MGLAAETDDHTAGAEGDFRLSLGANGALAEFHQMEGDDPCAGGRLQYLGQFGVVRNADCPGWRIGFSQQQTAADS